MTGKAGPKTNAWSEAQSNILARSQKPYSDCQSKSIFCTYPIGILSFLPSVNSIVINLDQIPKRYTHNRIWTYSVNIVKDHIQFN